MKLSDAQAIYIGGTQVTKIYVGLQEVYSSAVALPGPMAFSNQGFHASNNFNGSNREIMSQSTFTVAETQTHARLIFENAYLHSGSADVSKTAPGWTATISASIVDSSGNFTRITFGGSNDGALTDGGYLVSDEVELTAPISTGSTHFVRTYYRGTGGVLYNDVAYVDTSVDPEFRNRFEAAASVPDKVMSGTIAGSEGFNYPPIGIIGRNSGSSRGVLLIGDSICYGQDDDIPNVTASYGLIAPSLTGVHPNINTAKQASRAVNFLADRFNIEAYDGYFNCVITNYGTNDLFGGRTVQNLIDDLTSIRQLPAYADFDFYICTLCPRTDGANTALADTAKINDFNTRIRAGDMDSVVTGVFDIAAVLEDATTPGTWDDFSDTNDGVHPNAQGYERVRLSGVISL